MFFIVWKIPLTELLKRNKWFPAACYIRCSQVRLGMLLFTLLFLAINTGCTTDPRAYPYRVFEELSLPQDAEPVDTNGDGIDELVYSRNTAGGSVWSVILESFDGLTVDQANYSATLVSKPHIVDIGLDGRQEVLAPVIRNDSLFLSQLTVDLVNKDVDKAAEYFVAAGSTAFRDGVEYPWRPAVRAVHLLDGRSSSPRLIVVVSTGYAIYPRGIVELSGQKFSERREFFVGAAIDSPFEPEDYNGDGRLDLLLTSYASDNGGDLNGLADTLAYLIVVDLDSLKIIWSEVTGGEAEWAVATRRSHFSDRESGEIATIVSRNSNPSTLRFRDAATGNIRHEYRHRVLLHNILALTPPDGLDNVVFLDVRNQLSIIGGPPEFKTSRLMNAPAYTIKTGFDFDSDGFEDLFAFTDQGICVFDSKGRRLATLPLVSPGGSVSTLSIGRNFPDRLMITTSDLTKSFRIEKNPWYLFFRYWVGLVILAVICLLYLPIVMSARLARIHSEDRVIRKTMENQSTELQAMSAHLAEMQEQSLKTVLPGPEQPFQLLIKEVLDRYALDPRFDVDMFSGKLGYSSRQTIRKVKATTGKSPNELIWLYRIEYAKKLLLEEDRSIADVADESGFKSQAHFSTKFSEIVGLTPTDYRQNTG